MRRPLEAAFKAGAHKFVATHSPPVLHKRTMELYEKILTLDSEPLGAELGRRNVFVFCQPFRVEVAKSTLVDLP